MASAVARARVDAGALASLAPLRAPPLNETVQLSLSTDALGRDNGTDVASVKRRIANLLSSEPGVGVCDSTPRERVANVCLLYTSPSPRDGLLSRMPSSA